ncbi:MAG: Fe-S cluster assembly ATPase SufC [Pseudomonadota bacterium]
MLTLTDLHATVGDGDEAREILKGLSLTVPAGEVHAIMGPNGAGKSTLSYLLTGKDGYTVTEGTADLEGEDLLEMDPEERASKGLFLSFQYPVEIPGVPVMTFVRTAMNAQRKAREEEEISAPDFIKKAREIGDRLNLTTDMLKRPLNVGFSGGEKKRLEIFQMLMMEPRFLVLDETDSGLDIDALKTVAAGVNTLRSEDRGMLVITHYQRLLDHIRPDKVHILADGRIVTTGGPELAERLEKEGYDGILGEAA